MGHQVVIYGAIHSMLSRDRQAYQHNHSVLDRLPITDEWPWLTRSMFSAASEYPVGVYEQEIIHFGLTMKDDPATRDPGPLTSPPILGWRYDGRHCVNEWVLKFEELLRNLYWLSVSLHIDTDFEPHSVVSYLPTDEAFEGMLANPRRCPAEWKRTIADMPELSRLP